MTIIISITLLTICFGYLGALPGPYFTLHGEEFHSFINPSQGNTFGLVYIVLPALAFVVNVVLRFYSDKVNHQMKTDILVFVMVWKMP